MERLYIEENMESNYDSVLLFHSISRTNYFAYCWDWRADIDSSVLFKITKPYTYEQVNHFLLVGLFLRLPLKMTCT